jgi:hypothetical protein
VTLGATYSSCKRCRFGSVAMRSSNALTTAPSCCSTGIPSLSSLPHSKPRLLLTQKARCCNCCSCR